MSQEQREFKGYNEDQMKRIASKLGHTGGLDTFDTYLTSNQNAFAQYNTLKDSIKKMYAGGYVNKYAVGGTVTNQPSTPIAGGYVPPAATTKGKSLGDVVASRASAPGLSTGTATMAMSTPVTSEQMQDPNAVMLAPVADTTTTQATTTQAAAPTVTTAPQVTAATTTPVASTTAATGSVSKDAQVEAQTQSTTNVGQIESAQGTATQVGGAPTRTLEGGELVDPVADASKAAAFTETITAAQADPSSRATVQGQLATLMTSFDEGKTPAWAAGAMRNVTAQLAARGIGSSSMAGQALIQAALESSLPIATADAQSYATFEMTNLNNKQARAMLSAQQRATFMGQEFDQEFQSRVLNSNKISEVANMNFTADQAIAMENAQLANTVNLTNLSNKQAVIMAEAASLSQLDVSNLNNRQQAQVQNAQSFLDMDMANLTNEQQSSMFKAQTIASSILTDAAAVNAARQFNATSENQTDQFFSNLSASVSQFNATQQNAQSQFNAGQSNAADKFNQEVRNQRDQFNAQNSMVINQSNAQWRRQIATADTAAINRANEINAKSVLDISNTAYNNLWQEHRDEMDWAYKQSESAFERYERLVIAKLAAETDLKAAEIEVSGKTSSAAGTAIGTLLSSDVGGTVIGRLLGMG